MTMMERVADSLSDVKVLGRLIKNDDGFESTSTYSTQNPLRYGKFFPNGMRGQIIELHMRVKNATGSAQNMVVNLTPKVGGAVIASYTQSVPNGTDGEITVTIQLYWDYDSLFVYIDPIDANFFVYYDTPSAGDYPDGIYFTGSVPPWVTTETRIHYRALMGLQTRYPVSVQGTLTVKNIDTASPLAVSQYSTPWSVCIGASVSPTVYNVTMTNANAEYSRALPASCQKFLIHCRDGTAFRLAFVTGKVATPTEPYVSIPAFASYWEDLINTSNITLYFACATAGKVVEIIAWS